MGYVTVSLSDAQQAMLLEQVAAGEAASLEEAAAAAISAYAKARAQQRLEELLLEGMHSPSVPLTPELMEGIRREARLRR